MEKVTGISGIFLKAENPTELGKWYHNTLSIPVGEEGYTMFHWRDADVPERTGQTTWSLFHKETDYFDPVPASCMINYRVANLEQMLVQLREAGVTILREVAEEYGHLARVTDPEGNKIELWEPPATTANE